MGKTVNTPVRNSCFDDLLKPALPTVLTYMKGNFNMSKGRTAKPRGCTIRAETGHLTCAEPMANLYLSVED